jgi:NADH-quinone oxidoreductase subunit H
MVDPVNLISTWLRGLLTNLGLAEGFINFLMVLLGVIVLAIAVTLLDIFLVWVERKVVGRFQDRLGPNRLGPFGLIQPFADIIKLLIKEDILPVGADKFVYNLAPVLALGTVLLLWAVIPLAPTVIGADINVAVLYIVAIGAIGSLAIIMAGWASNNKYALLGAFRVVAMMVSYEIPMVIVLLVPVILARSMGLMAIVEAQDVWYIVLAPAATLILLVTSIAELGRAPFDLAEAESEIVAGFNIEYTGMKFGLFYAGELLHAITVSAVIATVFLGGWRGPFVEQVPILGVFYLFAKAFLIYWVIMWIKYSFPRLRIDQMLDFCWKFLTPLALVLLIVTAVLDKALADASRLTYTLSMLVANILIAWLTVTLLRRYARKERHRVAEVQPIATPPAAMLEESLGQE